MKGFYNIRNPKRLPRKLKKKIIKSWDRKTYVGIIKGYIILVPWVIVNEPPTIMCSEGCEEELTALLEKELKERYGEEKLKEIEARYAKKTFNENYYGKINLGEL